MGIIIPAIIPRSFADLADKLKQLEGIATEVQIDIVDGRLASPASWPYVDGAIELSRMASEGTMLPSYGDMHYEIDLMSIDPESTAGSWIEIGASRLTVHAESTTHLERLLGTIETVYGHNKGFAPDLLSFGLAVNLATDLVLIEPYIDRIDYVQLMGIQKIGGQGQPFDPAVLRKIAELKKKHPELPVQVDGGVSLSTAASLLNAGVSRLIVGSALWKAPDLKVAYEEFRTLTEQHGIYRV